MIALQPTQPRTDRRRERSIPLRFSSYGGQETHTPWRCVLVFGRRYYSPRLGRWINRDPIEEDGGKCLYCFVWNRPPTLFDLLGREPLGDDDQPELGAEQLKWLNDALGAYKSYLAGTAKGMKPNAIMLQHVADSFIQMGWGMAVEYLGNELKKVVTEQVVCRYHQLVRFAGEAEYYKSTLFTKGDKAYHTIIESWIDSGTDIGGDYYDPLPAKGKGYHPFTYAQGGKLLYLRWKDSEDGSTSWVVMATPRVDPLSAPVISFGQIFASACCVNNTRPQ